MSKSREYSKEDIKDRFNEEDILIVSGACNAIIESEETEALISHLLSSSSDGDIITKNEVQSVDVGTLDISNEISNEEISEIEPEEEEDIERSINWPDAADESEINGFEIINEITDTADTTQEFDADNPNEDDPFDAIEVFEQDDVEERKSEKREITIEKDITGKSNTTGELDDFIKYFRSRYKKLRSILESRISHRPLNTLDERAGGDTVEVIGMVQKKHSASGGDGRILYIEDTNGSHRVYIGDEDLVEQADSIVPDEVIGIEGTVADDGGIIFADELYFPDVPPRREKGTASRHVKVAMISDIHFGAQEMAVDKWNAFVEWLYDNPDIEYLLVAGDIIEGVGIYSGQQDELAVPNLRRQYKLCAKAFEQLPEHLDIIIAPGNHEDVRQAEPQPTFDEETRALFPDNVTFAGNPAKVTLEGVAFLLYHGVSQNPLIDELPGTNIQKPTSVMKYYPQKRHLAPLYGKGSLRISPEKEDYLVIEDVPDVLHCGHVHTYDIDDYRDVLLVNSGTWQHQTVYQERLDVQPNVGFCTVVDLFDLTSVIYSF